MRSEYDETKCKCKHVNATIKQKSFSSVKEEILFFPKIWPTIHDPYSTVPYQLIFCTIYRNLYSQQKHYFACYSLLKLLWPPTSLLPARLYNAHTKGRRNIPYALTRERITRSSSQSSHWKRRPVAVRHFGYKWEREGDSNDRASHITSGRLYWCSLPSVQSFQLCSLCPSQVHVRRCTKTPTRLFISGHLGDEYCSLVHVGKTPYPQYFLRWVSTGRKSYKFFSRLSYNIFKSKIYNGNTELSDVSKVLNPLDVPVRHLT
jgi:hypothetical protein